MQACNAEPTTDPDVATPSGIDSSYADRAKQYQQQHTRTTRTGSTYEILGFKHFNNKWQDCNTFVVALLKVETWIHGRILECVWWQDEICQESFFLTTLSAHRLWLHLCKLVAVIGRHEQAP